MNWYLHEPTAEPVYSNIERPVIRISSIEKLPERVVFDTSMPYMAPPSSVVSGAAQALQSSFTFDQRAPAVLPARPTLAPVAPKKSITAKREPAKVISTHRAAPPTNTAAKNNT